MTARHPVAYPFGPDLRVARHRLDNGLTVLLCEDRSAPVIAYQTWFAVGSRHERSGKTGLAHLFEHLMFNETEGRPAGTFDRKLEEAGAESNAATSVDWTFYHESIPRDRVGGVVELEAERMARLVLREPQIKSEKEVVANERRYRVEDDIEGAVSELVYETAFVRHAYRRPTIGTMQDIAGLTCEDCTTFYRTFYAPNNATIVVAGDFRAKSILARIERHYGSLQAAALPIEDVHPEPAQTDERRVSITKPTASDKLAVAYHGPALGDFDHAPLTLLAEILFSGRSSRCHRSIVQERQLATELRAWVSTYRDPGLFEIYATARPGRTAVEIEAALAPELERAVAEPVSDEELSKVKARIELSLLQSLETAGGRAEQIGFYDTVLGDPKGAFTRLDQYRRTTATDVLRATRRHLCPSNRTVVHVHPATGTDA